MIYYEIRNTADKILAGDIENCPVLNLFTGKECENIQVGKNRNVYRKVSDGSVRIVITDDDAICRSNRQRELMINVYLSLLPSFKEIERRNRQYFDWILGRFTHNLIKIQSSLKSQLQRLASDSAKAQSNYSSFKNEVERRIKGNTSSAAEDLCQVSNRLVDLDAQITGLRVISGLAEKIKPSYVNANINTLLSRLTHPFAKDFSKLNVTIVNKVPNDTADKNKIRIDWQLFNFAMWHFFDNATKYTHPNSEIVFTASLQEKDIKTLRCEMLSLKIEKEESDKIYMEKYRGVNAKKIQGEGIGMFMTKKALNLMKATIEVQPDHSTCIDHNGSVYCKNTWIFTFLSATY